MARAYKEIGPLQRVADELKDLITAETRGPTR
jgi:hypothetical protein